MGSPSLDMPLIGLGTFLAEDESELETALNGAFELGYRHIDTAWVYRNEHVIGKVLKNWIDSGKLKREDVFIVTKLPLCAMRPDKVSHFLDLSLTNLGLDYVDLYLIHVPFAIDSPCETDPIPMKDGKVIIDPNSDLVEVWKAMEAQVENGKAKFIGISNFDETQVEKIVNSAKIRPYCLQVELHVYSQQRVLRDVCSKYGIKVTGYSPIGAPGRTEFYKAFGLTFEPSGLLSDLVVTAIATKHNKTPAQICLRFLTQQNIHAIPKSVNVTRIEENMKIFDFNLDEDDMKQLQGLDKGREGLTWNFSFLSGVENHPEYPKYMTPPSSSQ